MKTLLKEILDLKTEKFPIRKILENSSYYPACADDGGVMRYLNTMNPELGILSHVMVDYHMDRDRLLAALPSIRGYHVHSHRPLTFEELAPNGWQMPRISAAELRRMEGHRCFMKESFAEWILLERDADMDASHGPERMSLTYICGDGAATYHALYCTQEIAPTLLAIIRPGHGFGFNWTNFFDPRALFHRIVAHNEAGMPQWLIFGPYEVAPWRGYHHVDTIPHYYPDGSGTCEVYQLAENKHGRRFSNDDILVGIIG